MKSNQRAEILVSILAGILAGATFLVLLFLLHWQILIDVLLSTGVFFGISLCFRPQKKIGKVYVASLPDGERLLEQLQQAEERFSKIQENLAKVSDPAIRQATSQLQATSEKILAYLAKHPEKIRIARQFLEYYQETAGTLLERYLELQESELYTEKILQLKSRTLHTMELLDKASQEQFQKLMRNELLDMEAEIHILEQTIKMEQGEQ